MYVCILIYITKYIYFLGVVEEFEGFKFYRSGESHKCIIWNYDVFGFDGGRTKQGQTT
jgi:hypothetical protein